MKSYGLHLQDYADDCWVYVEYVDDSRVYVDDCRVYAVYSVKNALVTNKRSACSLDDMNTWTSVSRLHSADYDSLPQHIGTGPDCSSRSSFYF